MQKRRMPYGFTKGVKRMQAYRRIENGFSISLNLSIYARPAVMKAFYKYHQQYMISYEVQGDHLEVSFETSKQIADVDAVVASILKELSYQMIRYDTMRTTGHVRELLVARALYATCIEEERAIENIPEKACPSWMDDQRNIFTSWSAEF